MQNVLKMFNFSARAGASTVNCSSDCDGTLRLTIKPKPGCAIRDLHTVVKNGKCIITSKADDSSVSAVPGVTSVNLGGQDLCITFANGMVEITNM